jgi:ligand-binding sensor domain-containing protein
MYLPTTKNFLCNTISLITALLLAISAISQNPVYRAIDKSNGLPSNSVYNLLQDKQGFIWMGHDKGLSRYDGKVFKQFNSNTQQGGSLSNLMYADNSVWCQDFSGNFYHVKGDSLVKEQRMRSLSYYASAGFLQKQLLTCVGAKSIQTLNIQTGEYKEFQDSNYHGAAVHFDDHEVLIINETNSYLFDGKTKKVLNKFSQPAKDVFYIRKFGGEYYGISKNSYPAIFIFKDNRFVPLPLLKPGLFIQDATIIDDLLWISTSSGAWCFGLDMKPAFGGHCFFTGKSITKILKDREGSYWFGTLDNGVLFVPDINNRLHTYNDEKFTALQIAGNGSRLYAGTSNNRILSFDFYTSQFTAIYKSAANHEVLSILEDKKEGSFLYASDRVFFINNGKQTAELKMSGKNFVSINEDLYAMAHSRGVSIIAKQKGSIPSLPYWLAREGTTWANNHFILTKTISRGRGVAYKKSDSTLYSATASGLYYFSPQASGVITYNGKNIFASHIIVDGTTVFAATFNDGLYKITKNNKATPVISKGEPVAKTIYRVFKSEDWLWLVGDGLLQRYDIDKNELIELTEADGLPQGEIKDIAAINATLYVATTDGLAELDEYSSTENRTPPSLVINKMLVNGGTVDWRQPLSLSMKENNVEINFSLLTFKEDDSLLIEYKINNKNWQRLAPGSRVISLSSLSSGNYTIEIRGFNEDGVQSETTEKISFFIAMPFYKRWWFFMGMLLLGMAAVYVYFRWRLQNEKKRNTLLSQKNKLEQELQQSLLSSIKSQMNPHFLFNALNTIQSYIYTSDKENASQYLGKFSELTRMILDMSSKDIVPLSEEIKALTLYLELEQLRFEDKLHYTLVVDETICTETTHIHSMLIQPYVENAIKHGLLHQKGSWELLIEFTKIDNYIKVTVDDNGIGRKKSEELNKLKMKRHQSFATGANQKRLEILNKGLKNAIALQIIDKKDEQGHPAGTRVILTIPISAGK